MKNGYKVISYAFAAIAGVCFGGGVAILSGGRVKLHGTTGGHYFHAR